MADLREMLVNLGFKKVQTYIQSGNIVLTTQDSKVVVCERIKKAILENFGFDISVIARTITEWKKAIEDYPFSRENEKIVGFTFLNTKPKLKEITINNLKEDQYKIDGNMVYIYCPKGFGKTKITNNVLEKKLNVIATTRNLRTTLKLLTLAESIS
jgi:uncharacterized protein (DUF1697 family)